MYAVIGIGNPDDQYEKTRHNAGVMVVESLPDIEGVVKTVSTEFMNSSGSYVRSFLNKHSISADHLVLVHDDWAFEVGDYKVQFEKGHNNHNGVKSVIDAIGTKSFWRVRIGIGVPNDGVDSSDFVLGQMSVQDQNTIKELAIDITSEIKTIINNE